MGSRQRIRESKSTSPKPEQSYSGSPSNGILVIGDDSVGNRLAECFDSRDDMMFVGVGQSLFDESGNQVPQTLEISRITELFEADIGISPTTAIVATSEDSQNLLMVSHLQRKLELENIVVRVNERQYIDAFADLSVELVDVSSIVGSVLAESLDPVSES